MPACSTSFRNRRTASLTFSPSRRRNFTTNNSPDLDCLYLRNSRAERLCDRGSLLVSVCYAMPSLPEKGSFSDFRTRKHCVFQYFSVRSPNLMALLIWILQHVSHQQSSVTPDRIWPIFDFAAFFAGSGQCKGRRLRREFARVCYSNRGLGKPKFRWKCDREIQPNRFEGKPCGV